ncbi:MAG: HNH endonuclease [Candidatus Marinimicrobia bacterium]|nr:HNH endonuclease [Candidatus Neomarinimicrobiota bacterium]
MLKLNRNLLDHPEHFDDEIREYRDSSRYIPTALERLLYELAGHRCTICSAPWMEIHHIEELSDGGKTEFNNLIVLCPNCHTRVHREKTPTKNELKNYKQKQEIAYELPILSRLTTPEKELIVELARLSSNNQVAFSKRFAESIKALSGDLAVTKYRQEIGLVHLQESSMLTVELEHCVGLGERELHSVVLNARFTGKGIKWVRYLLATERLPS